MTTCAGIFHTFSSNVFGHASIRTITPQVLSFEVMPESEVEIQGIYYGTEINFIECVVSRAVSYPQIGGTTASPEYTYLVDIRYTREKDTEGAAYTIVRDTIESIVDLTFSQLGHNFGGLVDYARVQEEAPTITSEQVAGRECFRSVIKFQGKLA